MACSPTVKRTKASTTGQKSAAKATKAPKATKPAAKAKATKPVAKATKPVAAKAPKAAKAVKPTAKTPGLAKTPAKLAAKIKPRKPAPAKKHGPRADFGAPIASFFAKQPAALRPLLEELRDLIGASAPDVTSAIKWGMPVFQIGDAMMCALRANKANVNLILSGPPGTFADPDGVLEGDGKTGRHLKLQPGAPVPAAAVRGWLAKAAQVARDKA